MVKPAAPSTCLVIAEAGVNHNGDMDLALRLVDEAAAAGADIVKFQTFDATKLVTTAAPTADYQKRNFDAGNTQLKMLQALELSENDHRILSDRCDALGIEFLSTPFDIESARFLVDTMGVKRIKVGSGELTNAPMLLELSRLGLPMILSTGMATLAEVEEALSVVAFGMLAGSAERPSRAAFAKAYASAEAREALARVTVMQCTTEYPAPYDEVNLRVMTTYAAAFGILPAYSDHTPGIDISLAAAALGATAIEKHFTLSRDMEGPDHKASLEPGELKAMVQGIARIGRAMGDGVKRPQPSEIPNIAVARKSLVAAIDIAEGERFTEQNLTVKRAGGGLAPMAFFELLGQPAKRAFVADELIQP
ncbi:MAG: N-acetylneuraminate synthase [Candidatus Brevundimonas phytovorans]|nr:N-acetylneuraminate synthase [Brevundimonas sp.]WEK57381.1 MAG: N-acetylneuraminate synthase [Brevundimonas sp.]